ncbi:oxidoreductase [filamentous cyanobacterium LEGE 11480]|uniref:Oxidoreductase n=1 Tax=Romeriopsis navalis LEGE 11480 TaxID=2777977 RepID=A0A928VRM2_9CYAN|nr:MDR family oxidoreductase [Romeriopsis navalis]MBE9031282.1 oxidoreductase [Romeriopsis navalis LEGE 11480]
METFQALILNNPDELFAAELQSLPITALPEGEVLVQVGYSSLNYKDALAVTNMALVVRQFPIVPGIDLAGVVQESHDERFKPGDRVFATGWGLGEKYWGGFAQYARLKADWLMPLPDGLDEQQTMQIGTAGFTAMLCVMALEKQGVTPASGEILVTGATGGVGSYAIVLLAKLGYQVVAATGRAAQLGDYLKSLGAVRIITRLEPTKRPLAQPEWAGAIDCVGSQTLATVLSQIHYGGSVATCGLAGGGDLSTSVYPFILRGVNLLGIDSVMQPLSQRELAWSRLAALMTDDRWQVMQSRVVRLDQVLEISPQLLAGTSHGRTVVAC